VGGRDRWKGFAELPDEVERSLRDLDELFARSGVQLAYLFGSLGRGESSHDVDLALLGGPKPIFELRQAIVETKKKYGALDRVFGDVSRFKLADVDLPGDGRDAVVTQALVDAEKTLTARLGSDRSRWTWGRLHVMEFVHPIGRISALAWIFNATAPPTGGDLFTVNNAGFDRKTYRQRVVASYRQIIDLQEWDRSVSIHTTGQSGLPFHRHYRDFVPMWATGQYHPMLFNRERIQQEAEGTLTLAPP